MRGWRVAEAVDNPMLLAIVHNALHETDEQLDRREMLLIAAVRAWMEGHVEAERPRPQREEEAEIELPIPPFPAADEPKLGAIVEHALETFEGSSAVAAVAYAAAVAWHLGEEEGRKCPGCFAPGNPEVAPGIRAGKHDVVLASGRGARHGQASLVPDIPGEQLISARSARPARVRATMPGATGSDSRRVGGDMGWSSRPWP